jgi:hypothetical protein
MREAKKKIEDSPIESEIKKQQAPEQTPEQASSPIPKPKGSNLEKFKSKRAPTISNVETLQTALPHFKIAAAKDFVRLHPREEDYWSQEFCFVNVPIKGQDRETLHLIDEEIAMSTCRRRASSAFAWRWQPSLSTCSSCVTSPPATSTTSSTRRAWPGASRQRPCGHH